MVAVEENLPIGMCIFSDIYMANHGLGFYLANVYVLPEYRNKKIFKAFLNSINEKKYNFMLAFVGDENIIMQKIISKFGAVDTELKSYFMKIK